MEKPENGLRGLKHWSYDLLAGLQVALVGLPLSLGIAVASGAPPVTGVISAIIGGLIYPFLGGSYVTISGPAAGLAPALLAGMLTLGHGDLAVGYPLVLVAICLTGLVQVVLSLFKAGKFAIFFPISVVEGMLAAIGVMIIVKMIPAMVGHLTPPVKSIPAAIDHIPENLLHLNPTVFLIGGVSLALLFFLYKRKDWWAMLIPPPLMVVGLGIVISWLLQLPSAYLIQVPDDVLEQGIRLPDFLGVWQTPDLWVSVLLIVVTLTLIDGTESLATIAGIDKIDPFRRRSDPNRTLRAMGISNMLSSLAGGLTIIPGGMKSTTNIVAGADPMGQRLLRSFYGAHLVGGNGTDQSDSARDSGRLAHLRRMAIVRAPGLPEDPHGRQGPAPDFWRHDGSHIAADGSISRDCGRYAHQAHVALLSSCPGFPPTGPDRPALAQSVRQAGVGRARRIVHKPGHPSRHRRRGRLTWTLRYGAYSGSCDGSYDMEHRRKFPSPVQNQTVFDYLHEFDQTRQGDQPHSPRMHDLQRDPYGTDYRPHVNGVFTPFPGTTPPSRPHMQDQRV